MSDQSPQVVQTDGQMEPTVVDTPENEISKQKRKRRPIRLRSEAWKEFTKFKDQEGNEKARCNFCEKEFFADSNRNGTINLRAHMTKCKGKEEKNKRCYPLRKIQLI